MLSMTMTRRQLIEITEKAIERGRDELRRAVRDNREVEQTAIERVREVARRCEGVDFEVFRLKYGCPTAQAGLYQGTGPCAWFVVHFDDLMHDFLEPQGNGSQGYSVVIRDDAALLQSL